jgi:hypothetical protein
LPGLPAPSYYPGMLETNSLTDATTNHKAIIRYDYDPAFLNYFGTNADLKGNSTNSTYSLFVTNALPINSTNSGEFKTETISLKKQPDLDPMLLETGNILDDYISLLSQSGTVSKN